MVPSHLPILLVTLALANAHVLAATTRPALPDPRPDAADPFFDSGPLPRLHIFVDPIDLKTLAHAPRSVVRAQVRETAPGQPDALYCDAGLHLKGGPGSFRAVDDKPGLTLSFDKFVADQSFHGLEKIHLNNSVQDPTFMCEYLGGQVFRDAGCPAPRVTNARVWLNGRDLGVYVLKEGFDGPFFKKFFRDKSGNLYEGSFVDVDGNLPFHPGKKVPAPQDRRDAAQQKRYLESLAAQKKTAETRWAELAAALRITDPARRRERLNQVLDTDVFLTFLACEMLVAHWDGYHGVRNNYRVYDDPRTGRFVVLPQGMDQLFQRPDHPLFVQNGLLSWALAGPADRQPFIDRLARIRQTVFTPERLLTHFEHVSSRLTPLMEEIGPAAVREHKIQAATLRQRLLDRVASVDRQLANPPAPLKFDAGGIATLSDWQPRPPEGAATADRIDSNGTPLLRLTAKSPGGKASWRTTVLLPRGRYTFEARMKTIAVTAPDGPNTAAGLRISGGQRADRLAGDADWQTVTYAVDVSDPQREVTLVCELAATSGQALVDPATLVLRKSP